MKVSELFATIGFNVDTTGLTKFSKVMAEVQQTIKGCVSGLKEFANAAEQINKAVEKIRSAYVPTQKEAAQRYRAETYYFRSAGKELRGRAIMEKGKGALFQINADLREQQEERLKKQAETNRARLEVQASNNQLNREKFEYRKEHQPDVSGAVTIGTIIGNIVSKALHTLLSSLKSFISSIFSFIKDTIRAAMAYRDYQSFTGRSVNELSDLMGMAAYTTNMTPQDVLKDAQAIQKGYWDMWFGKASPEFWMKIGVLPTGNGAQDLRNALKAIYDLTDKGRNTGQAMSLLAQGGLDEQYINIFKAMREGRANEFKVMDDEIKAMSDANDTLNKFKQTIEQAQIALAKLLLDDGGLNDMLDYFLSFLKTIVSLLRGGAFKGKSLTESMDIVGQVLNATPQQRKAWAERGAGPTQKPGIGTLTRETLKGAGNAVKATIMSLANLGDILGPTVFSINRERGSINPVTLWKEEMMKGSTSYSWGDSPVYIENKYDLTNRTMEEAADLSEKVMAKELYLGNRNQQQMNNTDATMQTVSY